MASKEQQDAARELIDKMLAFAIALNRARAIGLHVAVYMEHAEFPNLAQPRLGEIGLLHKIFG